MLEPGVRRFLASIGVPSEKMRRSKDWINCQCPLAKWTHGSGMDEHPSFGISISEGRSVWYCFGCMPKAQLLEGLLHNIFITSGEYPREAAQVFVEEEGAEEVPQQVIPDGWADMKEAVEPLPKSVIKQFPILQWTKHNIDAIACKQYLVKRGVPEWVQNLYQVRFDPERGCLTFPLTDLAGRIFVLRERSILEKKLWTVSSEMMKMPGVKFPSLRDSGVWFGMHLINWSKPVLLVEGEIKVMRLATLGEFNAIASATSSVSETQIDVLSGAVFYLGYDTDKAGALAHSRIAERIGRRVALFELDWSVVGITDPDELKNKNDLRKVMEGKRQL